MNRPYIICHMTTSLDGKVTGEHLRRDNHGPVSEVYYEINRNYKADAFACGRVTMEGSFTGGWYPDLSEYEPAYSPKDYLVDDIGDFFAVAFDPHGRLGWKSNRIIDTDGDPGYDKAQIIEVLTLQVSRRYLTYLQSMGIPYIFAGDTEIDIEETLFKLKAYFGINKLLLEGGSILNGAFQRAGFIDELSLVVDPVIGGEGKPLCMESKVEEYRLVGIKNFDGIIWMNYHASHADSSKSDHKKLADACERLFDLDTLGLSDAYYYSNLPLCVIDSVFSIGVRYTSTQNTVLNYCKAFGLTPYDRQRSSEEHYHTISQLIANLEEMGIQNSATTIFKNRQRTSSTNGILKAEAVYRFAKILQSHKIESFADLYSTADLASIELSVKQIPGQRSGLSWQYFLMLSGDDNLAKPDRHILRFIENQLGYKPSIQEAQQLMAATVALLKPKHPYLTVRLLDYSIWDASAHNKLP